MTAADQAALDELDYRIRTVLPAQYQDTYEAMRPTPMGGAGLKFDAEGRVAWDKIWGSFCDLAMAGGPPHKGQLLEPARPAEVEAAPDRHAEVAEEICRGITLATDLPADVSPVPGWVRVKCYSETMAGWLLRAIVMENVAARRQGWHLDVPASPAFRLEKEIKNVVTVIAKTTHYWLGHLPRTQRESIASLLASLAMTTPLVEPDSPYADGWRPVPCASVAMAVWMMRATLVHNVLARREGATLLVPGVTDADARARVTAVVDLVARLAALRGVV